MMRFDEPLIPCTLLKRYKRFMCDIILDHHISPVIAHCPNSGSMKGIPLTNVPAMVSFNDAPGRKLKYTLEMVHNGNCWIGTNTWNTNTIAQQSIEAGVIAELKGFDTLRREVKISDKSRIDFVLDYPDHTCFVEVKNVSLVENNTALFPDALTERGQKHIDELIALKSKGHRAIMLYIVQRTDCSSFAPAVEIDPVYASKLKTALKSGIEALVYQANVAPDSITLIKKLNIRYF
ncbi:MAG: DNA/RNA nuclease SfsA [Candidatus Auribacter fodinae]|uniref:Sugar fermentation stimulation protein homolog n=1 Tax=Candidatus Auribacter fodinae TaxID=2093366 RepID=A0A3A4R993_9BACT|nr:MAG: DNA/RNA nuclease SfsA [Candidatus Auribacter fodinae]